MSNLERKVFVDIERNSEFVTATRYPIQIRFSANSNSLLQEIINSSTYQIIVDSPEGEYKTQDDLSVTLKVSTTDNMVETLILGVQGDVGFEYENNLSQLTEEISRIRNNVRGAASLAVA
jgi:hypothetical protein